MDYRQKFKLLRTEKRLTQQDIAKICKVSDATVGHWESGIREMRVEHITTLCKHFNVSSDYILGLKDRDSN